jgi:hypothetical protein
MPSTAVIRLDRQPTSDAHQPGWDVIPKRSPVAVNGDINVLALVKGEERYIFLYDESNRGQTLRTLGRYASNPDLSFSWYDAAVLSQKIRRNGEPAASIRQRRFRLPASSDNHWFEES